MRKEITRELVWLLSIAVLAYFAVILLIGNTDLDIQLHDTYFVTSFNTILIHVILLITFAVYLVKESLHNFHRTAPNVILIAITSTLIIQSSLDIILLSYVDMSGWTIYPPLSDLPQRFEAEKNTYSNSEMIAIGFQIFLLIVFFVVSFRTGNNFKRKVI